MPISSHHASEPRRNGRRSRHTSRSASRSPERSTQGTTTTTLPPHDSPALRPSVSSSAGSSRAPSVPLHSSHASLAAAEEATGKNKKKNKQKRSRQEGTAAPAETKTAGQAKRETAALGQPLHSTAAGQSLLRSLSEVEFQLQLEQDRTQRTTLTPRDVANLILWSVPAPVPLIESPRIFFIKNKSHVRNVVVVYVNGWSYDELLCTGVGLPRTTDNTSTATTNAASSQGAAGEKGSHAVSSHGSSHESTTVEKGTPAEEVGPRWDKRLCSAMLSPVREGRCWARPGRGSGCAGGVQYCPLFIPSTRNEMEKDLWWRNDAPRRPGAKGTAPTTRSDPVSGPGVGGLFHRAMQVHAKEAGDGSGGHASNAGCEAAAAPSHAFQEHQHLWQDKVLLAQYALKLPTHAAELTELGFTLAPPPPSASQSPTLSSSSGNVRGERCESATEEGETKAYAKHDGATVKSSAVKEAWTCFDPPASSAASHHPKVYALDCEMVQVSTGESALARATLVDVLTGQVVLDLLVKPQLRVTDYLTRFSGIDEAMLDPVATTLADCQAAMKRLIDTETFVVGHSLENDFKACKLVPNCYVLDTAWLFPHPAGLPYKNALRFLAQKYLNRRIQQGSHDSTIDALVSAELAQLKLLHGPSFGIRARVSVLGLITAAGGDAPHSTEANNSDNSNNHTKAHASTGASSANHAAALDVQVHLFDDAVTLSGLLPPTPKASSHDAQTSTPAAGSASAESAAPPSQVGRIDAVPTRHDEDAMRKVVRALQRRSRHLAAAEAQEVQQQQQQWPSFGLFWVQLTQTKVDVVLPNICVDAPTAPSADRANEGGRDDDDEEDSNAAPSATVPAQTQQEQHTAAQYRVVHDTNRRVLRIIEACPQETLVIVLTGRCTGESGGNHFSRAQGACFAFIKDSSAAAPREEELTKLRDEEGAEVKAGTGRGEKTTREAQSGGAATQLSDASSGGHGGSEGNTPAVSASGKTNAVRDNTPPACQQQ
ncbi:hypothetical protein N2W54_004296 [Lotmaria passim]